MIGADPGGAAPGLGTAAMAGLMRVGSARRMTTGTASEAETSPFLTEARLECNRAEHVLPHARQPGSLMLVETIKSAIDDWAEHEMERAISSTRSNVSRRSDFIKSESEPNLGVD
jgi:hypothetical protein